jgi:hypothetical protein
MAGFLSAVAGTAAIPSDAPSRVAVKAPALVAPVAAPKPYPIAPPLDQVLDYDPIMYPSPYQHRGEGSVPFLVTAGGDRLLTMYQLPRVLPRPRAPNTQPDPVATPVPVTYDSPDVVAYNPALPPPVLPAKQPIGGSRAVMPVPAGQTPMRKPVAPVVDEVPTPGPVTLKVGNLDLSVVPWWGWALGGLLLIRALAH